MCLLLCGEALGCLPSPRRPASLGEPGHGQPVCLLCPAPALQTVLLVSLRAPASERVFHTTSTWRIFRVLSSRVTQPQFQFSAGCLGFHYAGGTDCVPSHVNQFSAKADCATALTQQEQDTKQLEVPSAIPFPFISVWARASLTARAVSKGLPAIQCHKCCLINSEVGLVDPNPSCQRVQLTGRTTGWGNKPHVGNAVQMLQWASKVERNWQHRNLAVFRLIHLFCILISARHGEIQQWLF